MPAARAVEQAIDLTAKALRATPLLRIRRCDIEHRTACIIKLQNLHCTRLNTHLALARRAYRMVIRDSAASDSLESVRL